MATALALLVGVAVVDAFVDRDLSLYALYFLPALYATWFLGRIWGFATSVVCLLIWLGDDFFQAEIYRRPLASVWNLLTRAFILTVVVQIVRLLKETSEKAIEAERQQRELILARDVQLRLLPARPPVWPGLDVSHYYKPADVIGGDYYDFIPLSPTRLGLAIADVSGKGLPSALLMASLQGLMRNIPAAEDVSCFVTNLNASLFGITAENRYATLFLAVLDTASGTLDYINAGHHPPLLFRTDPGGSVSVDSLEAAGPPVGLLAQSRYRSSRLTLGEGDTLVLYTDGVTDARNDREEEFGEEKLRESAQECLSLSAAGISAHISEQLQRFIGSFAQFDDITLVVVKFQMFSREADSLFPESTRPYLAG